MSAVCLLCVRCVYMLVLCACVCMCVYAVFIRVCGVFAVCVCGWVLCHGCVLPLPSPSRPQGRSHGVH